MNELVTAIAAGITAFTATNLDDILILMLFFSQVNAVFRNRHIIVGQYLGFTALVFASLPGFFGSLILPQDWIGLLGVLPIAIGFGRLIDGDGDESETESEITHSNNSPFASLLSAQTYSVAAVTVANGSDNISIYVPLFASSTWQGLVVILGVFFTLVGVWCFTAYRLTQMSAIADTLTRYGNNLVPFVLMGLGVLILVKSHTLESPSLTAISLVAGCFCLLTMIKNNHRIPKAEGN
ncbi:MAG TPA: cadmium resistance transporter [Kamptonema sp.]|nr:cadmium resistance transporter [Kamptonema sp.]